MRILLADCSEKTLAALNSALVREPGVHIVGKVMSKEALCHSAHDLLPDLVLLDWKLAGTSKQMFIANLHQVWSHLRVLVMVTRIEDGRAALAAGADAVVSKSDPPDWLFDVICNLAG
jgi:DNA-binding NarL/FixJ family response regulator